jgi:hypothetical protein
VKQGDALEPMVYDKGTITHILCTDFTIYQIEDKASFLKLLFLAETVWSHLYSSDKHKYNPVPLFAKPQLFEDIQNYSTTSDEQRGGFRGL